MSIAEKLQTIAENQQRVYESGYTDGSMLIYYATRLNNVFGGVQFPENFEFVARVKNCVDFGYMFNNCKNLKSVKITHETQDTVLDMAAHLSIGSATTPTLELVDFTEFNKQFKNIFNLFQYQRKLKTVLGEIDLSQCTNTGNAFRENNALEDIRFKANTIPISISFNTSPNLSNETIQSIFDGLATVETTQTLTLHTNHKILQSQVDSANAKGWTIVGGKVVSEEEYYG